MADLNKIVEELSTLTVVEAAEAVEAAPFLVDLSLGFKYFILSNIILNNSAHV